MRVKCLLLVAALFYWQSALGQNTAPQASKDSTLKSVELTETCKIQVPMDMTVNKASERMSPLPTYSFRGGNPPTAFDVTVLPYSFTKKYGLLPIDEERGLFTQPFSINGSDPLTAYFMTPGGQYAYYGWKTADMAYACTMNSPCPHKTQPESRYQTIYTFVVFDKADDEIVEFEGYYSGPSKDVAGFSGAGKLLHEVVVPSLLPSR